MPCMDAFDNSTANVHHDEHDTSRKREWHCRNLDPEVRYPQS